jgi:hypothetical protein
VVEGVDQQAIDEAKIDTEGLPSRASEERERRLGTG